MASSHVDYGLIKHAVYGFQSCGLWPYNVNKFTEEDFADAAVTEEADPAQSLHKDALPQTPQQTWKMHQ